jgi:GT2 family glycosyltransferase
MTTPRVLISILNWNKAAVTLECLASLRHMVRDGMQVDVLVIDNGSDQGDYLKLRDGADSNWVQVLHLEKNLGFTGGHNVALKMALEKNYDFAWLLNNDSTVQDDTLSKLVRTMSSDARCGAASPVIHSETGSSHHGWGMTHDWKARGSNWIPSLAAALELHENDPLRVCLVGTAILLRVQALRETGLLDERLFAYFDDNDISTRMQNRGWTCKLVFDATATHGARTQTEQPLYFFYLMFRNELIFWHTHMPQEYRKRLWLKIVNQALFNANRLYRKGLARQGDAALLGIWDFIRGRFGAPDMGRKPPRAIRTLCRLLGYVHDKQLRSADIPEASPSGA